MPRVGAITFGDLVGQLEQLAITCPKCGRISRHSVRRLALSRGRDTVVSKWTSETASACPICVAEQSCPAKAR
jgi:hypothetical protein